MGGTLSQFNNRLSFDFTEYLHERDELSAHIRSIAAAAASHRQKQATLQVVHGSAGLTAGLASAVAIVAAPFTLGLSVPAAVVGNSIAAASATSSAASYVHGHGVDRDLTRQVKNLRFVMDDISRKDAEVNVLMTSLERERVEPVVEACETLRTEHLGRGDGSAAMAKDKKKVVHAYDLPLTVLKTQGIFLGTKSIISGSKRVRSEEQDEFEKALQETADALDEETAVLRTLEHQFKYLSCLPGERRLPRGRLTYVDGGGGGVGCTRVMVVTFHDPAKQTTETIKSDSTHRILLPEGAAAIKVYFKIRETGTSIMKVDRPHPKQPWVQSSEGKYEVDTFELDSGDGVDAVFMVKGPINHSYVHKAWDFGRRPHVDSPRSWEWWDNAQVECGELLPDVQTRTLSRSSYESSGPCEVGLACGSCFDRGALAAVQVA